MRRFQSSQRLFIQTCTWKHASTPYQILNISPSATSKEIKSTYYKLSFQYHPDRLDPALSPIELKKNQDMYQEIKAAYEVLSHPGQRKMYDSTFLYSSPSSSPSSPSQYPSHYDGSSTDSNISVLYPWMYGLAAFVGIFGVISSTISDSRQKAQDLAWQKYMSDRLRDGTGTALGYRSHR